MSAANLKLSKSAEFLERPVAKRKMGIVITGVISLLILLLSLPFITWINLANPGALFAAIGVKDYSNIYGGYSLFNFLSFVKESGYGLLGFPAMLLMVAHVAATLFHASYLYRIIANKTEGKGFLKLYNNGQTAMLFSLFGY